MLQAPPMFVNFGSKQDYDFLESRNINIKNHILLMKMKKSAIYKQISEGIKKGAVGVLLYADPSQHYELQKQIKTIKELNPTILGRLQLAFGDSFCANNSNVTQESQKSIMVDVISFDEMQNIFKVMSLNASSKSWANFMKPSISSINQNKWSIIMSSHVLNLMHTYYNVIAALEGAEEPDRYILIGSNRESLSNSDDPLGGTVAMMEISRVFGELNRVKGWIPRRTVIFCSWGLQGDGHFNSESWAQLLHPLLTERAVAYLSVEVAVRGNSTLKIQSAPVLETVIEEASMLVPNCDPAEQNAHRFTLGETMQHMAKVKNTSVIDIIHGEGDYQMFLFEQGIPSLDFGYDGEEKFTDSTFSFHRAITELWAILIWSLADDPVLPLNPAGYSKFLIKSFFVVQKEYASLIEKHLALFNRLHNAIVSFNETASDFGKKVHSIDKTDCMRMRVVNDQLVRLEKQMLCFPEMQNQGAHPLLTEGNLPSVGFGVLQDLLEESLMWPESTTIQRQIQQELTMLSSCIQNGELLLKDVVVTLTQIQT
ncbi:unnamed protein product [Bemisia tabaci]|uniref:Uncharacterized protein n=1 Tax=Bemisia tabaci TaxID=7038 RepID=A0A9P0C3G0_BEMTA|nr:unnamed protein product [Bemisia tabaci]